MFLEESSRGPCSWFWSLGWQYSFRFKATASQIYPEGVSIGIDNKENKEINGFFDPHPLSSQSRWHPFACQSQSVALLLTVLLCLSCRFTRRQWQRKRLFSHLPSPHAEKTMNGNQLNRIDILWIKHKRKTSRMMEEHKTIMRLSMRNIFPVSSTIGFIFCLAPTFQRLYNGNVCI